MINFVVVNANQISKNVFSESWQAISQFKVIFPRFEKHNLHHFASFLLTSWILRETKFQQRFFVGEGIE